MATRVGEVEPQTIVRCLADTPSVYNLRNAGAVQSVTLPNKTGKHSSLPNSNPSLDPLPILH